MIFAVPLNFYFRGGGQPTIVCTCRAEIFIYVVYILTELRLAFSLIDKDKDGNISQDEVREVMASLGQQCSDQHLQDMFEQVDLDGE